MSAAQPQQNVVVMSQPMLDKSDLRHTEASTPATTNANNADRKENPLEGSDLEACAQHRRLGSHLSSASTISLAGDLHHAGDVETFHPLKREVRLVKEPMQDFGTSLCLLHGDIFITDVREGSPAWKVGFQPGDRIESIDDVHIRPDEFHRRRVMPQKILQYLRAHQQLEIKVCDQPVTKPHTIPPRHFAEDSIGLEYHNCVVTSIDKESPADVCGIKQGESIYEVNNEVMVGKPDDEVVQVIEDLRCKGPVNVRTVPAELALEMVWAQTMINSRNEDQRRDSWTRRHSLPHLLSG